MYHGTVHHVHVIVSHLLLSSDVLEREQPQIWRERMYCSWVCDHRAYKSAAAIRYIVLQLS
jgi:hypothetical protein